MDVDIRPDPTPEERAAIIAALAQLEAEEERRPGAWWEAGLRDCFGDDEEA